MDSRLILEVKEHRTPEAEFRCVAEVLRQATLMYPFLLRDMPSGLVNQIELLCESI